MKAKNLDDIYTIFDPSQPLPGVSEYYVKRKYNPLEEIKRNLLLNNIHPPKYLFAGHRGSGKSTELNRLMAYPEIQEKYFTVNYSVKEVLDTASLEFSDLLVSIGAQIFIKADKSNLQIRDKLLQELNEWKDKIELTMAKGWTIGGQAGATAGLASFFNQLQAILKLEYTSRKDVRQTIEGRISELIDIIDLISYEVKFITGKEVLVAIDDLDKPDLEIAKKIFSDRYQSLIQPKCLIIYTIPIALHYSSEFFNDFKTAFTKSFVLPNVAITKRENREPNEEGRSIMREFVEKRMNLDLIKEDALEYAITISGGLFREMARLIRDSATNSAGRGEDVIEIEDVENVESEIGNEFRRMLTTDDYNTLIEIYKTRRLIGSEKCSKLLHNLSILEYRNQKNWCDVHPAIISILKDEFPNVFDSQE
jgi:hypothetical protein